MSERKTSQIPVPERAELRKFGLILGALVIGAFCLLIPWIWDLEIAVTNWPWPLGGVFIFMFHKILLVPTLSIVAGTSALASWSGP